MYVDLVIFKKYFVYFHVRSLSHWYRDYLREGGKATRAFSAMFQNAWSSSFTHKFPWRGAIKHFSYTAYLHFHGI
jgi:hypothetical protein